MKITSQRNRGTGHSPIVIFLTGCAVGIFVSKIFGGGGSDIVTPSMHLLETTASEQSEAKPSSEIGWKTIDVFYGKHNHPPENFPWYSQCRQDEIVAGLLGNKTQGYFIDLAANHASRLSNTYALERHFQWNGLCIEPNPQYWLGYMQHRSCRLFGAVVGGKRMEEVDFNYDGVFGGIAREEFDNKEAQADLVRKAYTVPIEEIFEKAGVPTVVDYLSLDVEGAELYVMKAFPFDRYQVKIMTVERPSEELIELFTANGFEKAMNLIRWGETLWIHKDYKSTLRMDFLPKNMLQNHLIINQRVKAGLITV